MTNVMSFMSNNVKTLNDNESIERVQSTDQVLKTTKEALEYSLKGENIDLLTIIFSENNSVNRRIISALGFYGVYTINELLLIDIDEFGKRYGVGKIMINYIELKIKELKNN